MKRLFWGLVGIGLGAVVGAQAVRWANRTKQRYSPPNLARGATGKIAQLSERLKEAVSAGLEEMTEREAEIRSELGMGARSTELSRYDSGS